MITCKCFVRLDNKNIACHESIHRIEYCPLHANAEVMLEALEKIERKCQTSRDPHDSIEDIVGRFYNIRKVASEAISAVQGKL